MSLMPIFNQRERFSKADKWILQQLFQKCPLEFTAIWKHDPTCKAQLEVLAPDCRMSSTPTDDAPRRMSSTPTDAAPRMAMLADEAEQSCEEDPEWVDLGTLDIIAPCEKHAEAHRRLKQSVYREFQEYFRSARRDTTRIHSVLYVYLHRFVEAHWRVKEFTRWNC